MINFVAFIRVLGFFCETQVRLAQIIRTILMLRMQEMAFPGFKFKNFPGEDAPGPPYWVCPGILWLDPPLITWFILKHSETLRLVPSEQKVNSSCALVNC